MADVADALRRDEFGRPQSRNQKRAEREKARERFGAARRAERRFARQLKHVANQVGAIVRALAPGGIPTDMSVLYRSLEKYAQMLEPWANAVSRQMVEEVARRDEGAWHSLGKVLGRELRKEIETAPTGMAMREHVREAEGLITSLPREAAQRVQKLVIERMAGGRRAEELAKEIARSGQVTKSRAMLIARTETTRAATALVQARAQHIGSEGYIWRTSKDADVRDLHRKLEGTFHRWDSPPVAGEKGERAHPGAIYNCRCWPEVVIPDALRV